MRAFITILVGTIGVVLGVLGAGFLSLSGVDLGRSGFERGSAWEDGDSEYGVFLGCALLFAWLVSLVGVRLSSRVQPHRRGLGVLGRVTVFLSVLIVVGSTLVSVAVLPRLYDYAP